MLGAFTCPHCMTQNACDCENCKPYIKEGEYVNKWDESGNILICGKCGKNYSPDQSLDAEVGELSVQKLIEKQMITNYSKAEQSMLSPNFGNTYVRHSTVKLWKAKTTKLKAIPI